MYVFGSDKAKKRFKLLKLNRLVRNPTKLSDVLQQDPQEYSEAQVTGILEVSVDAAASPLPNDPSSQPVDAFAQLNN
jgi:hypothetical protein